MCPGYRAEAELIFRRHCGEDDDYYPPTKKTIQPFESRIQCPTASPQILQQDAFNESEIDHRALALFLDDYCIVSKDKSLSRGYLDDLPSLLAHTGLSSDTAKAAKIAALASLGNKVGESNLVHRANMLYSDLLSSFQVTMSKAATSNTIESLTIAVLLGLYEVCHEGLGFQALASRRVINIQIISATEEYPGEHGAHAGGVAAILSSQKSPFSRHPTTPVFQEKDSPLLRVPSGGLLIVYFPSQTFLP